jgi:CheY-like chemotaxis protein
MIKVLIAEDNAVNRELLRELLEARGYTVVEACDGQEALHLIEQAQPDVLLLDIGMPVLDGFAVVRKIRENPRLATLPVLAVTAYAMQGDREKILNSGFDGYLSKPISAVALAEALEPLLSKRHGRSARPNQSYESQASEKTRAASVMLDGGTNLE